MGKLSDRDQVLAEIELEGAFFPDEEMAQRQAEAIYTNTHQMLSAYQANNEFAVKIRLDNPLVAETTISRLVECIYLSVSYQRSQFHYFDGSHRDLFQQAGLAAAKVRDQLAGIPEPALEQYFVDKRKRGTVFSKSARRSLEKFIDFCTSKGMSAPPAPKGRKPQDVIELLTGDVVELFEFWVNRPFRKNLTLIKQTTPKPDQFAGSDAACIYAILSGIDPSITPVQAKTALKKIPARKLKIQK